MQLYDRDDQAQTQSKPGLAAALVRSVEAAGHEITLARRDSASGVSDAYNALPPDPAKFQLDVTAFGSELHGIVDKICNGFEQEVAISSNANFLLGVYHQGDVLLLCDR